MIILMTMIISGPTVSGPQERKLLHDLIQDSGYNRCWWCWWCWSLMIDDDDDDNEDWRLRTDDDMIWYDKIDSLERPVFNDSEAINLTFGLTLQQIIDVVSHHTPPHPHSSHYHPPYPDSDLESRDLHPRPRDPHPGPLLPPSWNAGKLSLPNYNAIEQAVKLGRGGKEDFSPLCRYSTEIIVVDIFRIQFLNILPGLTIRNGTSVSQAALAFRPGWQNISSTFKSISVIS